MEATSEKVLPTCRGESPFRKLVLLVTWIVGMLIGLAVFAYASYVLLQ